METVDRRGLIILVLRLLVAGLFVLAALPKIQEPAKFAASVQAFQLTGPVLSGWIAIVLPWLELAVGVGLFIPMIRQTGGLIIAGLLILFIGLHASAWARGLDINCGCFGAEATATSDYRWLILRNTALLIATVCVLWRDQNRATKSA